MVMLILGCLFIYFNGALGITAICKFYNIIKNQLIFTYLFYRGDNFSRLQFHGYMHAYI